MAAVRELVTTLKTELDDSGFKQYEAGCQKIIELTKQITGVMAIAFSAEKAFEFAKGIVDSIQNVNKLRGQITNLARPQDDVASAMESTYDIAQKLGVSYEGIVHTFRNFLEMSNESKISQDKLLKATENTQKALMVDRVSAEGKEQFYSIIERIEIMGKASPRMIGQLGNISKAALSMLKEHFKTDEDGLRKLAKAGKITADVMLEAFSKTNNNIEERFNKLPWTIERAWQYGYDKITKLFTGIVTGGKKVSAFIGGYMKIAIDYLTVAMEKFATSVGGVTNIMETLGIALAIIVGPYLLTMLVNITAATVAWAAANGAVALSYVAMGAGILGIAAAIQDIVYWIQNKHSFIGTWVGPFEKLSENFAKLDIFAGLRAVRDVFTGDFAGAWREINKITEGGQAAWGAIAASVTTIGGFFVAWKIATFIGLDKAIVALLAALVGIERQAKVTAAAVAAATGTGVAAPGTPAVPGAPGAPGVKPPLFSFNRIAGLVGVGSVAAGLLEAFGYIDTGHRAEGAGAGASIGSTLGFINPVLGAVGTVAGALIGAFGPDFYRAVAGGEGQRPGQMGPELMPTMPMPLPPDKRPPEPTPPPLYGPPAPEAPPLINLPWRNRPTTTAEPPAIIVPAPTTPTTSPSIIAPAPTAPPAIIVPEPVPPIAAPVAPVIMSPLSAIMPPGALGPPPQTTANISNNDNKAFTFNNTNAITVTVPEQALIADEVTRQVATQTQSIFDRASRDLGRSSPRTEAASG